jgi:hypothetical protein
MMRALFLASAFASVWAYWVLALCAQALWIGAAERMVAP